MDTTKPLTKEDRTLILERIKSLIESNLRLASHLSYGRVAWRLEMSCYNAACADVDVAPRGNDSHTLLSAYSAIAYRVMHALETSEYLRDAISRGQYIDNIGSLTSAELDPTVNERIRRDVTLQTSAHINARVSHAYICPRCKQNETDGGISSQRRAADEGSTLTITCLKCKARWQTQ